MIICQHLTDISNLKAPIARVFVLYENTQPLVNTD